MVKLLTMVCYHQNVIRRALGLIALLGARVSIELCYSSREKESHNLHLFSHRKCVKIKEELLGRRPWIYKISKGINLILQHLEFKV